MIEVVSWLQATLTDVEREARAATVGPWVADDTTNDGGVLIRTDFYDGPDEHIVYSAWSKIDDPDVRHIVAWNPAVVLASVEADRAILAEHHPEEHWAVWSDSEDDGGSEREGCTVCTLAPSCSHPPAQEDVIYPCRTVLLVASRYRYRPGWRAEWACG